MALTPCSGGGEWFVLLSHSQNFYPNINRPQNKTTSNFFCLFFTSIKKCRSFWIIKVDIQKRLNPLYSRKKIIIFFMIILLDIIFYYICPLIDYSFIFQPTPSFLVWQQYSFPYGFGAHIFFFPTLDNFLLTHRI